MERETRIGEGDKDWSGGSSLERRVIDKNFRLETRIGDGDKDWRWR